MSSRRQGYTQNRAASPRLACNNNYYGKNGWGFPLSPALYDHVKEVRGSRSRSAVYSSRLTSPFPFTSGIQGLRLGVRARVETRGSGLRFALG